MGWFVIIVVVLWFLLHDRIVGAITKPLTPEQIVTNYECRCRREMAELNKERVAQGLPELVSVTDYVEYEQYLWETEEKKIRSAGRGSNKYGTCYSPRSEYEMYLARKKYIEGEQAKIQKQEEEKMLQTLEHDSDESFYDSCL